MASDWNARTQVRWPIALSLSFKFIPGCSAVQFPYQRPQYYSVSPLLFDPDPSLQNPWSASLSFPTPGIYICVLTFPSLHHISCMRDSLLSSSCAAYNADWYAQLGVLPTFCYVSCPLYLGIKHTYRLVSPEIIHWVHTLHRLSITVSFFIYNLLFWIKSAQG